MERRVHTKQELEQPVTLAEVLRMIQEVRERIMDQRRTDQERDRDFLVLATLFQLSDSLQALWVQQRQQEAEK